MNYSANTRRHVARAILARASDDPRRADAYAVIAERVEQGHMCPRAALAATRRSANSIRREKNRHHEQT